MVVRNGGLRLLGGFAIGLMRVRWAWGLDLFVLEQWVIGLFFVGPMAWRMWVPSGRGASGRSRCVCARIM